jgi:hypothetical protein
MPEHRHSGAARSARRRGLGARLGCVAALGLLLAAGAAAFGAPGQDTATVASGTHACRLAQSRAGHPLFKSTRMVPGGPASAATTVVWLAAWPQSNPRTVSSDRCLLYLTSYGIAPRSAALARVLLVSVYVRLRPVVPTCSDAWMPASLYRACLERRHELKCSSRLRGAARTACRKRVSRLLAPYYRKLAVGSLGGTMSSPQRLAYMTPGVLCRYRVTVGLARNAPAGVEGLTAVAGLRWQTRQVPRVPPARPRPPDMWETCSS